MCVCVCVCVNDADHPLLRECDERYPVVKTSGLISRYTILFNIHINFILNESCFIHVLEESFVCRDVRCKCIRYVTCPTMKRR